MKNVSRLTVYLLCAILLHACGRDNLERRLFGEWLVESYEEARPGAASAVVNNIGTMKFGRDGKGVRNISYSFLGIRYQDTQTFQWVASENYVRIAGPESKFTKTWIAVVNERTRQEWRSTDEHGNIQIMRLKKK